MAKIGQQGFSVIEAFDKFRKALDGASIDVVKEAVNAVYETSQELVPVDTGALKSSGRKFVEIDRKSGKFERATGSVSYGGESIVTKNAPYGVVDYAAAIHSERPFLMQAVLLNEALISGLVRKRFSLNNLERYGYGPSRSR